jgi:hypothetical protein
MKFKNTAPGGRGIGHGGKSYECEAGGVIDIPDAVIKAVREDSANDALFGEGGFVPVTSEAKAAPKGKPEGDAK